MKQEVLDAVQIALAGEVEAALASSYERASVPGLAHEHTSLALRSSAALPATPLAETTRAAILRICERLGVSTELEA